MFEVCVRVDKLMTRYFNQFPAIVFIAIIYGHSCSETHGMDKRTNPTENAIKVMSIEQQFEDLLLRFAKNYNHVVE